MVLEKNIFKMKDLYLYVNIICKFWKIDINKYYFLFGVFFGIVSIFVFFVKEEKYFLDLKWFLVMRDIIYNKFKKLNLIKWVI